MEDAVMIESLNKFFILLTSIIAISLLTGCVTTDGSYGTTKRDRDLDNMFLRYEVLPDHNYYTTGGYDKPDAILALHQDYELDNTKTYWRLIPNVDYGQMRIWIDTIAPEQDYRYSNAYFAAYILNPEGEKIGAWYSVDPHATVKFLEGNMVLVHTPVIRPEIRMRRGRGW
jgi:hypothetical protein